jgi:hypothetical protein
MTFIRESCPAVRVAVASEQLKETGGHQVRSNSEYLEKAFPGMMRDDLWLEPSETIIYLALSRLFCRMP